MDTKGVSVRRLGGIRGLERLQGEYIESNEEKKTGQREFILTINFHHFFKTGVNF